MKLEFKKVFRNVSLAVGGVLLLSGCVAKGPQFNGFKKPDNNTSNVYIYRTQILGSATLSNIHQFNMETNKDKVLGVVKLKGYILTNVKPGVYKFWASRNEVGLKVFANKIYCIKHYVSIGFFLPHPQFKLVDLKQCKKEIKDTRLTLPAKSHMFLGHIFKR